MAITKGLSRLRALMRELGWNQSELARRAAVDPSTVNKLLKGHRSVGLAVAHALERATLDARPDDPVRAEEWLEEADESASGGDQVHDGESAA